MPTIKIIDKRPEKKLKVAAYCRVSTSDADQLASLDNQKKHYEEFIKAHSEWAFVGVYSDDGISGRSINGRDGFKTLISDAMVGKIDFILTKSISRFARNTLDCLETVRTLAVKGIYVKFEQDNINTKDMDAELYMSVVSALAENESKSLSENIKWGIQKRFQDGTYKMVSPPYGYIYEEGVIKLDNEKAEIVKKIFTCGLDGLGGYAIAKKLNELSIPSPRGKKWDASTVKRIQNNIFYTGNIIFQSTYIGSDGKRHKNKNNVDAYYCEKHHDAIISQEVFDRLQKLAELREEAKEAPTKYKKRYAFSGKVCCGECNSVLRHKIQHTGDIKYPLLACPEHIRDKSKCSMKAIKEAALKDAFCTMVNKLICIKNRVLKTMLSDLSNTEIPHCENNESELDRLNSQEALLLEMQAKHNLSSSVILPELIKISKARDKIRVGENIRSKVDRKTALRELIGICDKKGVQKEFSDNIFTAIVDRVVVLSKKEIIFELKCGLRLRERLVRA
ncbi:recombinase family protein [Anaerovibrio lipolyticus]|uniref:recombinase family protein n=1 Tax=Anaerovibrio lipolyticus TaxID=82374 RepID=UPI0026F11366|nr:recombinase family protein [Anaerovibrio lipolyticus]MBE6105337.1 recombinase family protein [Anaerovibrio lipolyticus]